MEQYDRLLKKFIMNIIPNYGNFIEDLQILVSPNERIFQRFVRDFQVFLPKLLIISTSTENNEARKAVHEIHETIKQVVIKNPNIRNENWWNDMTTTYLISTFQDAVIKQIRANDSSWIKSWSLMANLILKNVELKGCSINALLKIVEVAFRLSKTNPVLADQAFICWIELIEIISANNNRAQISKVGGLFVKPLATNVPPKTYALKFKAWETLIEKIAIPYNEHVADIVVLLLKTAFNKNNNCLAHHMPNECLTLLQKLLNTNTIESYSINLVSALSQCAQFNVNPVQFSSLFLQIIAYCQTLKGDKYINHLKELLRQTIQSKTLKQFPSFEIITKIGFMMENENFLATMNDFKTRSEIIMPFMNLVIENKDIHTANSRTKENILETWRVLYSSFVTHLSINEITQDEKDMLLSLIVFPLSSNLWSSATSKRWISFCEILKQKDMFTEQGEKLISYMMESLKQSKMTTIVALEILKIISNIETTLWPNFVPILELVCDKLPSRDFHQIMSVIHLTELAIGVDPKSTYTLINLKLTCAANNVDQLQQHKIKTSLLKLRKKCVGTNDELKLNTSPELKTNGSFPMKSNFLYRMAKAEEKKKDSVSTISNIFNTKEKSEEKTEKENFDDQENKKKEEKEKDISISNKLLDSIDKPVDYVEKENLPKSPLLVKSNQIHIVCNDAKSPKSPGLNKSRKSPGSKVITPKRTTPSKCTYFENDNASDYVVVTPKQTTTVLTEHQKEVMSKRRSDIPALYQDLSQDTQTISFIEDNKSNDKQALNLTNDESPKSHTLITPNRAEFIKPNKPCSVKKLDFRDQPKRSSVRNLAKSKEEMEVEPEEKNFNKRKSDPGNRLALNVLPKKPNGDTDPVPRKRGRKRNAILEDKEIKKINSDIHSSLESLCSNGSVASVATISSNTETHSSTESDSTDLVIKRRGRKRNEVLEDKEIKNINGNIHSSLESLCSNGSVASVVNTETHTSTESDSTDLVTKRRGRKRNEILEDKGIKKINCDIHSSLESLCSNGSVASVVTIIPETPNIETPLTRGGRKRKQTLVNKKETPVIIKINTETQDVESISTPGYSDMTVIPITPNCATPVKKSGRKIKESLRDNKEGTPITKINTETQAVDSPSNPNNSVVTAVLITPNCENPVAKRRGRKRKESLGDIKEGTPVTKISTETTEEAQAVKSTSIPDYSDMTNVPITPNCENPVAKKRGRKKKESLRDIKERTPVTKINTETNEEAQAVDSTSIPNYSDVTVVPETPDCENPVKKRGRKIKESLDYKEETPVTKINTETEAVNSTCISDYSDVVPITPNCESPVKKRGRRIKESLDHKEGTPVTKINAETEAVNSTSISDYSDVVAITPNCESPVKKRGRKIKESLDNQEGTLVTKINAETTEETQAVNSTSISDYSDVTILPITPNCESPVKKRGRKIKESLDNKEGTPVTKIRTGNEETQAVESISFPGYTDVTVLPITPNCTSPVKMSGRKIKNSLRGNKGGTPVTEINTETTEETTIDSVQETPKCESNLNITPKNDGIKEKTSKLHEINETTVEKLCQKCKESIKKDAILFEELVESEKHKVKLCKKCKETKRKETTPLTEVIIIKETPKSPIKTHREFSKADDLIFFSPKVEITPKQYFNNYIKKSPDLTPKTQSQIEDKMEIENSDSVIKNQNIEQTSVVAKDTPKFEELVVNEIEIKANEIQNKSLETEDIEKTKQEEMKESLKTDLTGQTEELQNQVEDKMEIEQPETPENIHKRKRTDLESPISDSKRPKLEMEQTPVSIYKRTHRQKQRKRIQSNSKCTINFVPNNLEQWLYKWNKDVVKKDLIEEPKEETESKSLETPNEQAIIEVDENIKTPTKYEEPDKTLAYNRGVSLLSSFVENDEMTKLHLASTREVPKISNPSVLTSPVTSRAGRIMLLTKENALLTPTKRRNIIPQQFGENWPKGPTEEWVACTPDHEKTPSRSSLKVTQSKDVKNSEEAQPKRVSFLDPPVTLGLIFNDDSTGALHLNDTPQDSLKRVWAKQNKIDEKIEETLVIEISDEETSFKTDEYDLKSLPNINNCDKPVTELLSEIDNFSLTLESEFIKLGVQKVNEIAFLTQNNIEELTIVPPKQQTLYLAVKAFLEKNAENESIKEIEEIQIQKDEETNQQSNIDIANYQGVITPQQLLQLAENNKSFLESLHDLMAPGFLSKVFSSKISK